MVRKYRSISFGRQRIAVGKNTFVSELTAEAVLKADSYLEALAAIFLTMARTSLRSLSFRLTE